MIFRFTQVGFPVGLAVAMHHMHQQHRETDKNFIRVFGWVHWLRGGLSEAILVRSVWPASVKIGKMDWC